MARNPKVDEGFAGKGQPMEDAMRWCEWQDER